MKTGSEKTALLDIGLWTAALLMGVYLLMIIFGDHGLMALGSMKKERAAIEKKNARLEKQNSALYKTIRRLENDPEYIEYVARQELHMVAPGEIVFKFSETTKAPQK